MNISNYTKPELDIFRSECNFVNNEIPVFEMRSKGVCIEEIAEALNMSVEGIKRISCKVNHKIKTIERGFL